MSMHFRSTLASIAALAAALAAVLASGCATPEPPKAATAAVPAPAPVAQAAPGKSAPIEVVSAQFGVFGADPTGRRVLYETAKFPAVIAAPYGWYIIFKTEKPTVIWREEFELPEPPPTWGPGEAMGIYIDGQLIREFAFDIEQGPKDEPAPRRGPHGGSTPRSTT
jgi:hypothetical protein